MGIYTVTIQYSLDLRLRHHFRLIINNLADISLINSKNGFKMVIFQMKNAY